jgi:hemoglobin
MVQMSVNPPGDNLFTRVGGRPFFDDLVARFYAAVDHDPVIRPLYPDDLTDSITHTAGFLAQFWGGGTEQYSDHRGHPRLRARHIPFPIGQRERDAWLGHMTDAVNASDLDDATRAEMLDYFEKASTFMMNADT